MIAVTVKNKKVVPVSYYNTLEQRNAEASYDDVELKRIKKKYNLHDTMVVIPGEYDTYATLTRKKKLFGYNYDSYCFKIERYKNQKLQETKYIVVSIMYGC